MAKLYLQKPSRKAVQMPERVTAEHGERLLNEYAEMFYLLSNGVIPDSIDPGLLARDLADNFEQDFHHLFKQEFGRGFMMGAWVFARTLEAVEVVSES